MYNRISQQYTCSSIKKFPILALIFRVTIRFNQKLNAGSNPNEGAPNCSS